MLQNKPIPIPKNVKGQYYDTCGNVIEMKLYRDSALGIISNYDIIQRHDKGMRVMWYFTLVLLFLMNTFSAYQISFMFFKGL
jgi:hypothetical protein